MAADPAPGYWDKIIGPGKPLDTDIYFILSSDTLVNLSAKDPNVITTGPATIDPSTGQPYGRSFPIVAIRDFVNVQKALVESLGISKLHAVMGASMGALQAYEWSSSNPGMVRKVIPVIGAGEADGWVIAWSHMWAAPILLDPNWNKATHPRSGARGRSRARTRRVALWNASAIEATLDAMGKTRASMSDANHFLYLVKASPLLALMLRMLPSIG